MAHNFKHLFAGLSFVSLLIGGVSCSKEAGNRLLITPKHEEVIPKESLGYLGLSILSPNSVVLRSSNDEPMTTVKHLMFLFYDKEHETLRDLQETNISSTSQLNNIVVRIKPGDYKLVVIANATEKIRSFVNLGSPISKLTTPQTLRSNDLYVGGQSMVMSNEQGPISIDKSQFQNDANSLQSISVSIEPTLARVLVYGTPQLRAGQKGHQPAKYIVNNLPKDVSILRQLNKLSNGTMEVYNDQSERSLRYAKSANWDAWSATKPSNTESIGTLPVNSLKASDLGYTITSTAENGREHPIYAKESTLPEQAFLQGIAPYVLIAYPYIPQGLTLQDNEGWVSYNGAFHRESEVKKLLNAPDGSQLSEALRTNSIQASHFDKKEGFSIGGINFYYQGYSYYTVFIKHFVGSSESKYGRYGLVRGNEYHIKLLSINNPGSPTPISYAGNLDPIVERSNATLSVQVSAVTERNQDVNL